MSPQGVSHLFGTDGGAVKSVVVVVFLLMTFLGEQASSHIAIRILPENNSCCTGDYRDSSSQVEAVPKNKPKNISKYQREGRGCETCNKSTNIWL